MTKDERKWLDKAKAGNYDAFEKLARAYEGTIFNFALKMCGHVEDAKDVLQETLLAAFRSLRGFRGESKLSTWFFKVAMSACQKMRRKGKFQPDYELSLEQLLPELQHKPAMREPGYGPEEAALQRESQRFLDEAIRAIPLRYRLVLVLRDVQGFSTDEASEILKLSPPAVRVRLHRARLFLRKKLTEYLGRGFTEGKSYERVARSDCREVARLLSAYLEEELDKSFCGKIKGHLDGCEVCTDLCESLKATMTLCRRSKRKSMPASVRRETHTAVKSELLPMPAFNHPIS